MLSVSGQLDRRRADRPPTTSIYRRRSLYVQTARWDRSSFAMLFDAANPDVSTEKRTVSIVAPQALLVPQPSVRLRAGQAPGRTAGCTCPRATTTPGSNGRTSSCSEGPPGRRSSKSVVDFCSAPVGPGPIPTGRASPTCCFAVTSLCTSTEPSMAREDQPHVGAI